LKNTAATEARSQQDSGSDRDIDIMPAILVLKQHTDMLDASLKQLRMLQESLKSHDSLDEALARLQTTVSSVESAATGIRGFVEAQAVTTDTDMKPSVEKVFSTPELHEMTLSNLDLYELLTAMQVSKLMLNTIKSSVRLQRQMFLLPDHEASSWSGTKRGHLS
jgi:hypothetical protein